MEDNLKKGRELNLEGIADAPAKVTVGFKCEGREKIRLAHEANQASMTLSEYVECIVSLRHDTSQLSATKISPEEVEKWKNKIQQLQQQLAIYEQNEHLQRLLTLHRDQQYSIKSLIGKERLVVVNHIADIFEVVASSFKMH